MKKNDENKLNKLEKFWMILGSLALALFTFFVVMV